MNPVHLRTLARLAGPDKRGDSGRRSVVLHGDGDVLTASVTTADRVRVDLMNPQFAIVGPVDVDARHLLRAIASARNDIEVTSPESGRLALSTLLPRATPWRAVIAALSGSPPPRTATTPESAHSCRLSAEDVARLEWVAAIAPTAPSRHGLHVVECEKNNDGDYEWIATDGARLHVAPAPPSAPPTPARDDGKLPAAFAQLARRLMPRGFVLPTTPGHVVAANGVWRLESARIVVDFPSWRGVLPASQPECMTVDADRLRAPLPSFIALTKDSDAVALRMDVEAGALRCRVRVKNVGNSEATVPLVTPPTSWTARGLRARFLLDALRDADGTVEVKATPKWDGPVTVTRGDGRWAVLMPMRMDGGL